MFSFLDFFDEEFEFFWQSLLFRLKYTKEKLLPPAATHHPHNFRARQFLQGEFS